MSQNPVRIIQISDMHLLADTQAELLGVKTQASFEAVLDLLQREGGNIDLIILSGDISQDGSDAAYRRLTDMIKVFRVPVYCVPGNHDDIAVMSRVFPLAPVSTHRHIMLKEWQVILLNSQKTGAVEGLLDDAQLAFMENCLQDYPEHHAIVLLHHQPVSIGSQWLDKLGLTNAEQLWKTLSRYPKVNTVLFGHVHQEFEQVVHGIKCYSVPSTCIQFKRKQNHFGLEKLSPGCRWIDLYENGYLETGVLRTPEYVGFFDENAKGY